jgi:UDP-N-acetylglucosamine acyltransferase
MIHPTAVVGSGARLGAGVVLGPFCVVEDGAELGDGVVLGPHVHVHGCARVGARTRIATGSAIGGAPQDFKYHGEPTRAEVGADCLIYENVTVHRATGEGVTVIGDGVMLMAGSHVGHNCVVGNHAILTNDAKLGGHAHVGERAILSAGAMVHQFCRVGRLTMLAGSCGVGKDAPPFSILSGALPAAWRGPNTVGLRRNGFSPEERAALKSALVEILTRPGTTREAARAHLDHPLASVRELAQFVLDSKRGVVLGRRAQRGRDELE